MKVVAFPRSLQGTGASRRLRNAGQTPGIVYGGEAAPVNIALDHNALFYALKKEAFHSSILDLEIDGKTQQVLLRDFQIHAFKPLVLHVDFQRVDANRKITMHIPVHFVGGDVAPALKNDGVVNHAVTELEISCLPKDLPEFISVDLSGLNVGDAIHLHDLKLPAGVEAVTSENITIATATEIVEIAEPEEPAAAPAAEAAPAEEAPKEDK